MTNLGERIVELRKNNNMSQEMLADKVGVSRQAISKWERNEASPDIYNAKALADVFEITVDELMNGNDEGTKLKREDIRNKAQLGMIVSVAVYLLSAFAILVLPFETEINIFIIGIGIVFATSLIIYSGFEFEKFKRINHLDEDFKPLGLSSTTPQTPSLSSNRRRSSFAGAVAMSCIAFFLFMGIVYGLWHPAWLVFLLIPVFNLLYGAFIEKQ